MSEADFDVIVVGAGCAGSVAAYVAASAGKSVLMVERGNYAGAKNMTGGRIYSHSLKEVFPDFEQEAPIERKVTHERIALLDSESMMTIDFTSPVLRGPFDQWLAEKAEEAGAEAIYGIPVEELIKDETGRVVGVRAGEDEITGQVVILCEGTNSMLAERCLGNPRPKPNQMAVGIKETFELPASVIEDRFLTPEGEGAAMLFVGDCTKGHVGGGFLYANKESISLGLVATISTTAAQDTPIYQMMEDFKNHPAIAPMIKGAKMVEHSGHMVPEGGYNMIPQYIFDGCLLAGETAGFCMNLGYQVRGMDFAVASGRMAAEAACLASYKTKLEDSFVIKDLRTFQAWPATMEHWDRMFTEYPTMVREVFNGLFCVDGKPQQHLSKRMMPIIKKRGLFSLFKEIRKAVKAL